MWENYSMLTSSASQYLHPDYLNPLPTTLDAKKSPLAMLAQTCSSIGKDPAPSKSIIPPLEKNKDSEKSSSDKSRSPDGQKRATSRGEKDSGRDSDNKPGFRTVPPKEIPPLVPISSSSGEKSGSGSGHSESVKTTDNTAVSTAVTRPVSAAGSTSSISSQHGNSRHSNSGSRDTEHSRDVSCKAPPTHPSPVHSHYGNVKPSSHPLQSFSGMASMHHQYPGFPMIGHGIPVDATSTVPGYPSPLAAHSGLGLSQLTAAAAAAAAQNNALKASASAYSPYVAYARVRTPSGATTLVPVCRDPYCTHCQMTLQNSHLSSTCTAPGCAQCAHEKSLQSLSSSLGFPGASLPILPSLSAPGVMPSAASALSSLHAPSLYAHSVLGSHQGLPYVCSWVAGNEYCGKRFVTSEELLQHLRSHTSSADMTSALAASYGVLGIPGAAGLAGCHGHFPTAGQLSPNSLRRTYPTSLSPVTSILSANRYHPYKSPLGGVSNPLAHGQPLPSLGQYYSPYTLYGSRLGAAAVP